MQKKWIKFPNGRVWCVAGDGSVAGSVAVVMTPKTTDFLEAISETVTGTLTGLVDIAFETRGGVVVGFRGNVAALLARMPLCQEIDPQSAEAAAAFAAQYGLNALEVEMLQDNLEGKNAFPNEQVIQLAGSLRDIRYPAYPAECSYVRVTVDGMEIARFVDDEWEANPRVEMGHLLDAIAAVESRLG